KYITYGARYNVWLIPVEGGIPVNLTENLTYMCRYPHFSPDGTEVTYTRWPFDQNTTPSTLPSSFSIEAVNITTGEIRVLIEDANWANFSSDGGYVVYLKKIDHQKYGVYDFQTGEESVYDLEESPTPLYDWPAKASICPDNNHFIITALADKDFRIHVFVPNIYADGEVDEIEWDNNQNKFYRVSMETGETELLDIGGYAFYNPEYSPDGTKLLFTRYDYNHYDFLPSYEVFQNFSIPRGLYIKDPDTGEFVQITIDNFYDVDGPQEVYEIIAGRYVPLSSQDSKISKKTGVWKITREVAIYNLLTGDITKVGDPDNYDSDYGCWSPDGTKVCYVRTEDDISYLHIFDVPQGINKVVIAEGTTGPTAVSESEPESITIIGNYPNPFNQNTTLHFSLQQSGFVELVVYNMMGQQIRELISVTMNFGNHTVSWDGRDNFGNDVSSGIYISRLSTENAIITGRMTLIK
ncbi:MAG: T9SS type A sorting domain-containing protein, partial [Candidatus Latescibacteria bacterium]|nr:T9SS type A sorting domain-containing protein [Candidatus Latescibacterota bacterium]